MEEMSSKKYTNNSKKQEETVKISKNTSVATVPKLNRKHGIFMRTMVKILKGAMYLLWPTRVYFKERFPETGRAVVVCNHYSKVDANPILAKLFKCKNTNVVFKSELTKVKVVANFLDALGGIPIRRGESDLVAIKEILKRLEKDEKVLVFPEGTRNYAATKEMLPFREGAAMFALKTHSPIVPLMYYDYPRPFQKNYLIVGEPFTLEQFENLPAKEGRLKATNFIRERMEDMRKDVDLLVEDCKGNVKKYNQIKEIINKNK